MCRLPLTVALAFLTSIAFFTAACSNTGGSLPDADVPGEAEEELPPPKDIVSGVGTVQRVELEGGFYGIVADDSTRYNPQNLTTEYQEDGLRVRFRAVTQDSVMTTQMWGQSIEILDILRLNDQ